MFEIRETGQGKLLIDVFCPEEEEPYRLVPPGFRVPCLGFRVKGGSFRGFLSRDL